MKTFLRLIILFLFVREVGAFGAVDTALISPTIDKAGNVSTAILVDALPPALRLTQKQLDTMQEYSVEHHGGFLRVMLIDDPCLAKMEAAMRTMTEFIPQVFGERRNGLPGEVYQAYQFFTEERKQRRDQAWLQWIVVMRECWREP